jgi:hypothetical protein
VKNNYFTQLVWFAGMALVAALAPTSRVVFAADIPVSDDGSSTEQVRPRVAVSPGHSFVVVWEDKRTGSGDIFLQRFDLQGRKLGMNLRVNSDTGGAVQASPSASVDGFGRYLLAWQDFRYGSYPVGPNICAQQLDSSGNLTGSNRRLTTEPPDSLRAAPDLALAPSGGGLVVWEDYRNRNWDIYAQKIAADGSLVGQNFKLNDDQNAAQQHAPRVAVSPDGWYAVTWYDNRWANDDIFVQRLESAGSRIGQNIKVNSDAGSSRQAFPDVAADGVGCFTVVWVDWRNGTYPGNPDIYARKFDTLFNALYLDARLNKDGSTRTQRDPSIAADRLGNVGIVWSDSGATSFDISGQMVDVDGTIQEPNFRANASTDSAQVQPDIALDGRYRYVAWADKRAGNWDIYASITKYNDPTLAPSPSTLTFSSEKGRPLPESKTLVIAHTGYNRLSFRLKSSVAWLTVTPDSGTTTDTVSVAVTDTSLPAGTYAVAIGLVDLTNNDSSVFVPVTFDYREPSPDTLRIGSVRVGVDSAVAVPLWMFAGDATLSVTAPLRFDTTMVRADSFALSDSLPLNAGRTFATDSGGQMAVIISFDSSTPLPPGRTRLGSLWVTARSQGWTKLDTTRIDTLTCMISTVSGKLRVPVVQPGEVTVDQATSVDDHHADPMPSDVDLAQNYPNPFNGMTVIGYELPRPDRVLLEVFNVLGQRVATLSDRLRPAGRYSDRWDGRTGAGAELPSGVYFYRLQAGGTTIVRKMVLLN